MINNLCALQGKLILVDRPPKDSQQNQINSLGEILVASEVRPRSMAFVDPPYIFWGIPSVRIRDHQAVIVLWDCGT